MITILSIITSVKDYVEIVHKLIESDSTNQITNYYDFGAMITYLVLGVKQLISNVLSFSWLKNVGSLCILIPDIASAMISEISVLDGYFHNAFELLLTAPAPPISYGDNNYLLFCLEKFSIGLINSLFLCLPTSTAHIITLRRFVMQGLEAGYIAGLGTIAGNVLWIGSIIFGLRFIVIPWLSLDMFRYLLGFILVVKYMWDSYSERQNGFENLSKTFAWNAKAQIFLLNFLLAFTEQTNIYPFISNLSIGSDSTIFESFPADSLFQFLSIHLFYMLGIIIGSLSLLQLTCWFWENPAYNIYMWTISSLKGTSGREHQPVGQGVYYKFMNFFFLYLTMICSISNIAYFGLDYTITNPLGFVHEDRLINQKVLLETSFLNTKASDRNTRRNRGRHGRRERWKRRVRRYRTFDASLYDQGVYDLFTMEDLNYGFDRFWLRRKIRNHRVRFRFFPGPWMRSFKKQLARPRLESFMGPRVEFFRILFEQVYHPEFHEFRSSPSPFSRVVTPSTNDQQTLSLNQSISTGVQGQAATSLNNMHQNPQTFGIALENAMPKVLHGMQKQRANSMNKNNQINNLSLNIKNNKLMSIYFDQTPKEKKENLRKEFSALRKFVRKVNTRINTSKIRIFEKNGYINNAYVDTSLKPIYSKKWKRIFSKMSLPKGAVDTNFFVDLHQERHLKVNAKTFAYNAKAKANPSIKQQLSKRERQILRYKTFLTEKTFAYNAKAKAINNNKRNIIEKFETLCSLDSLKFANHPYMLECYRSLTLLHPIKFYLQKEQAFQRKWRFYGANVFRNFGVENNAPYFRTLMRRFFYYYKPTLRWERTMRTATMRKARRKGQGRRTPRKFNIHKKTASLSKLEIDLRLAQAKLLRKQKKQSFYASKSSKSSKIDKIFIKKGSNPTRIQKPTHFYKLLFKRASRYRYQIYKDVLEHWYYSPFNRLLVKFDVDSFIRRQPSMHFMTKNEENLLNLRRFLLHEHYETLRWYTYMQHYRSMKAHIGGTKSFASRLYNQQFSGTFKKVRYLFAISPSSTENPILRFDQPLYNEFYNNRNSSIFENTILHEELLADEDIYRNSNRESQKSYTSLAYKMEHGPTQKEVTAIPILFDDLQKQSKKLLSEMQKQKGIREYLIQYAPIKENEIKKCISEKNYWELTRFLYKGEKIRGHNKLRNSENFCIECKTLAFHAKAKGKSQKIREFFEKLMISETDNSKTIDSFQQDLWFQFIKKCRNRIYNRKSLKLYLSRHVEKRKRQKQRQEKYLKQRLQRMKNWFLMKNRVLNENSKDFQNIRIINVENTLTGHEHYPSPKGGVGRKHWSKRPGLTTALQKSLKDGLYFQKNWTKVKSNIRNNRMIINWSNFENKHNKILRASALFHNNLMKKQRLILQRRIRPLSGFGIILQSMRGLPLDWKQRNKSVKIEKYLKARQKSSQLNNKEIEKDVQKNLLSINEKTFAFHPKAKAHSLRFSLIHKKTLTPFIWISKFSFNTVIEKLLHMMQKQRPFIFLKNAWRKHSTERRGRKAGLYLEGVGHKHSTERRGVYRSTERRGVYRSTERRGVYRSTERRGKTTPEKILQIWRQQENILSKRRKIRKKFKRLRNTNNRNLKGWKDLSIFKSAKTKRSNNSESNNILSRKKTDMHENFANLTKHPSTRSWKEWRQKYTLLSTDAQKTRFFDFEKLFILKNEKQKQNGWKIGIFFNNLMNKKFKRKRSRLRRYRRMKGRGPIKKHKILLEKLKRQFRLLKKYGRTSSEQSVAQSSSFEADSSTISKGKKRSDKKVEIFRLITKRNYIPKREFILHEIKQRHLRLRKWRFWKKHKKKKYAQNKRKQRKRRRYAMGKIRVLNKELKRIKANLIVKKWWWETFLPSLKANQEILWQIEAFNSLKDKNIKEKIELSHEMQTFAYNAKAKEQKESKEFETFAFHAKAKAQSMINNRRVRFAPTPSPKGRGEERQNHIENSATRIRNTKPNNTTEIIFKITENLFVKNPNIIIPLSPLTKTSDTQITGQVKEQSTCASKAFERAKARSEEQNKQVSLTKFSTGVNPMPFYAGWDENLRQFVVTNRLLSNSEAGYLFKWNFLNSATFASYAKANSSKFSINTQILPPSLVLLSSFFLREETFSKAPLNGMNAATTLYWQVPFTTYDPDQLFALGMDGFSPIGWQKFHFRHSKQTTKPLLVKTRTFAYNAKAKGGSTRSKNKANTSKKINLSNFEFLIISKILEKQKLSHRMQKQRDPTRNLALNYKTSMNSRNNMKNQYRKIQKRYKRVKKHPRSPVWFPSGPLTHQVLPVHYIYVFYKRYRLPRDRYIGRFFHRKVNSTNKEQILLSIRESSKKVNDLTLRRRVKPKRKYHRKTHLRKNDALFIKRRQFKDWRFTNITNPSSTSSTTEQEMGFRPASKTPLNIMDEQRLTKNKLKQRRKSFQQSENLRVRQLRRRIQRQVIRPTWRYRPRSGGFTWPGDYLRFEMVRAPKLNLNREAFPQNTTSKQQLIIKKKRRSIQEWQIQPKNYLLQKHNIQVFKNRLQKTQNSNFCI